MLIFAPQPFWILNYNNILIISMPFLCAPVVCKSSDLTEYPKRLFWVVFLDIFSCTPRCKGDGGSTLWGLHLLACCIIVNKTSAFCVGLRGRYKQTWWLKLRLLLLYEHFKDFLTAEKLVKVYYEWGKTLCSPFSYFMYLLRLWIVFVIVIYWTVE